MPKIILLVAIAIVLFISVQQLKALPPEKRKKQLINIAIWGGIALSLVAVISGRLHWLGAVLASLFGIAKAGLPWLIRFWPLLQAKKSSAASATQSSTLDEAYETLGLQRGASRQEVVDAHRRKMLKMHPDKGGNHEDASRLNEAKKIILEFLDSQ